jgi:hypothetical protein
MTMTRKQCRKPDRQECVPGRQTEEGGRDTPDLWLIYTFHCSTDFT